MLRQEIGDQKFWEGIREYYRRYQLGNANGPTNFRVIMEGVCGSELKAFFDQWVYRAGHPGGYRLDLHSPPIKKAAEGGGGGGPGKNYLFSHWKSGWDPDRRKKSGFHRRSRNSCFPAPEKPEKIALDRNALLLFGRAS